jgi:septum formation protein
MNKLILASTSPRRHEILKQFGIKYSFIRPTADEEAAKRKLRSKDPYRTACSLAHIKALSVLPAVKSGIILGSDTVVILKGRLIGKPRSKKDAFNILLNLSRNTHSVVTAVAFIDAKTGKTLVTYDESFVTFKKITRTWIRDYIATNNVMDKAGAYAIQGDSDPFIKEIRGSYYNIVGLPIEKVKSILKKWDRV